MKNNIRYIVNFLWLMYVFIIIFIGVLFLDFFVFHFAQVNSSTGAIEITLGNLLFWFFGAGIGCELYFYKKSVNISKFKKCIYFVFIFLLYGIQRYFVYLEDTVLIHCKWWGPIAILILVAFIMLITRKYINKKCGIEGATLAQQSEESKQNAEDK